MEILVEEIDKAITLLRLLSRPESQKITDLQRSVCLTAALALESYKPKEVVDGSPRT